MTSSRDQPTIRHVREFARNGLVRNFTALFSAEIITKTLALVSFAVVSRVVGPAAMGFLAVAQTLTAFAAMVADGGISTLSQRQIAADASRVRNVASLATVAQVALASLTMMVAAVIIAVAPIGGEVTRLLVVLLPVFLAQAFSLVYVLQGLERMRDVAYVRVATQVTTAGLALVMVLATSDVLWAAIAIPIGTFLGDGLCLWFLFRRYHLRFEAVGIRPVGMVIRGGSAFLGIALLTQMLNSMDVIALSIFGSPEAVGIYSVAYRLVLVAFTVSALLTQAAFPQLVRRFRSNIGRFQDLLRLLVRLAAHFTLPATAMLVVEAPSIIRALFGPDFAASSDVLRLLAFWIPLGFYNSVIAIALVAAGRQQMYLGIVGFGVVVTAVGLVILVPIAGSIGAAQAVLVREASMVVLFSLASSQTLRTGTIRIFARQALWFIVPFAALFALNLALPFFSLFLSLAVLLASVLLVEWASGWPLMTELLRLGRTELAPDPAEIETP